MSCSCSHCLANSSASRSKSRECLACSSAGATLRMPDSELTSPSTATAIAETPAACNIWRSACRAAYVADLVREHGDDFIVGLRQSTSSSVITTMPEGSAKAFAPMASALRNSSWYSCPSSSGRGHGLETPAQLRRCARPVVCSRRTWCDRACPACRCRWRDPPPPASRARPGWRWRECPTARSRPRWPRWPPARPITTRQRDSSLCTQPASGFTFERFAAPRRWRRSRGSRTRRLRENAGAARCCPRARRSPVATAALRRAGCRP